MEITVGYVSGIIAALITALQFLVPMALALLVVGVLKEDMSAVSWSVVSRNLHSSHWPSFLRSDSATSVNVDKSVKNVLRLGSVTLVVIAIASIVTPLGLYDTVLPSPQPSSVAFPYIADSGPFGYGTPVRSTLGFNRRCGYYSLMPCPGSDTIAVPSADGNLTSSDFPNGYDSRIPTNKATIFQSGLVEQPQTVSSFFDIEYRSYTTSQDPKTNNGSFYITGSYRQLGNLVLDGAIEAVEGLLVNSVDGGVAFRNHTLPTGLSLGATWTEDLLFMEPDTQCVSTNLTIDFTLSGLNGSYGGLFTDLVLTDQGGFANINHTYPEYNRDHPEIDADLTGRAYKGAWMFNVLSAVYFNVTRPKPNSFGYLDSKVGKSFPLPGSSSLKVDALSIAPYAQVWSELLEFDKNSLSFSNTSTQQPWPNPFGITSDNFTDIDILCSGVGASDVSNATNTAVGCGIVYGAPRHLDGSTSLIFEPGSKWSMPLYSCATGVKVSVKTVSFRFNGTEGLKSLRVDSISDQVNSSNPITWGIENNPDLSISDVAPLWGLVSSSTKESSDLSVVQNPYLYLPGLPNPLVGLSTLGTTDNMPATDFHPQALGTIYGGTLGDTLSGVGDYSGKTSLALFAKWQNLTASAAGVGKIVDLIFTDLAANALVGSKSWLNSSSSIPGLVKRADTGSDTSTANVSVTVYKKSIRYNWLFGIPAYLSVLIALIIGLATLALVIMGRASPAKMKAHLNATSAGRIFAIFLYPGECDPQAPTASWTRGVGAKKIGMHKPSWVPSASEAVMFPEKLASSNNNNNNHNIYNQGTSAAGGYAGSNNGTLHGYEQDEDPLIHKTDVAIAMHSLPPSRGAYSTYPPPAQTHMQFQSPQQQQHQQQYQQHQYPAGGFVR